MKEISSFLAPIHYAETIDRTQFNPLQWGAQIQLGTSNHFDPAEADIILLGCGENRGANPDAKMLSEAPDAIREQFYQLYNWYNTVKIFDAGNILQGASLEDSRAALKTVLGYFHEMGKIVFLIGGSHDLCLEQYNTYKDAQEIINATLVDMLVDLDEGERIDHRNFLMDMLCASPNFIAHYNHIAFQSYFVSPLVLETLDKIRFDFYRVGRVKEQIEEMEPVIRGSHLFSFDINAVKISDAPMNQKGSPNGLAGDEACLLMRYAGMATHLNSIGLFGIEPLKDVNNMTAVLGAQMLWYFIDGYWLRKQESALQNSQDFIEYNVSLEHQMLQFKKSKKTNRWWMQIDEKRWEPCSYNDYLQASRNEFPERWMRYHERL